MVVLGSSAGPLCTATCVLQIIIFVEYVCTYLSIHCTLACTVLWVGRYKCSDASLLFVQPAFSTVTWGRETGTTSSLDLRRALFPYS